MIAHNSKFSEWQSYFMRFPGKCTMNVTTGTLPITLAPQADLQLGQHQFWDLLSVELLGWF